MEFYNKITYWENRLRRGELEDFRKLVVKYFKNAEYNWKVEGLIENEKAKELRPQINKKLHLIKSIISKSGVIPIVHYTPPANVGGYIQDISVIINIFRLHMFEISHEDVLDFVDISIGVYEHDKTNSILRTSNPFFWFGQIINYIATLPFRFIGKLGFDRDKAESSVIGKLFKGVIQLIMVFASFLVILDLLGYLEWFKKYIKDILLVVIKE